MRVDIMAQKFNTPLKKMAESFLRLMQHWVLNAFGSSEGLPRNVAARLICSILPENHVEFYYCNITGTNGKTTTTRLLAHIVKNNGFKVGLQHQMIYMQNHMMEKVILQDH
jgi:cyanophycin synthetase